MVCFPFTHSLFNIYLISKSVFVPSVWNPFVDRVDADSETLNGRSNRHRQLLDDNLEAALEERDIYVNNIKCMLAELSGRVSDMEGKLCRCHDEEDVEVAEVEDDDDPTSELSYETEYHTPVAIAGLLEDVPNRLVPIGELEITRGGFEEEVRDGDEDSDQELESLASQVAEGVLVEEDDDQQVDGLSRDLIDQ